MVIRVIIEALLVGIVVYFSLLFCIKFVDGVVKQEKAVLWQAYVVAVTAVVLYYLRNL